MDIAEPADWVEKPSLGYAMNSEFSEATNAVLTRLMQEIKAAFPDSIFCPPPDKLHITLLDWIAPLVDYDGRDKDALYAELRPIYDRAITQAMASVGPITVHFDEINLSPNTIYIVGHDQGQFARIRQYFLDHVDLLPGTKLPPQIIHSSLARFTKPIDLVPVREFLASKTIDITETVTGFRLIRTVREPILEFDLLKRYPL